MNATAQHNWTHFMAHLCLWYGRGTEHNAARPSHRDDRASSGDGVTQHARQHYPSEHAGQHEAR